MKVFHWKELHYLHHQITPIYGMLLPEGYVTKVSCRLAHESQKQHFREDRYVRFDAEYVKYRVNKLLSKIKEHEAKVILLSSVLEEMEADKSDLNEKLLTPTELQEVTTEESTSEIEVEQV